MKAACRMATLSLAIGLAFAQEEAQPSTAKRAEINGSMEFGYRWMPGKGGSEDVYRSIVNLGEGPKLFGAEASVHSPGGRLYDRVEFRASSWGGDPYSSWRLDVSRSGIYNFFANYRNIAYFNSVPSFANPSLDVGGLISERSFDIRQRFFDTELELRPGSRFSPYFAYSRSSGSGRGVTTFVTDGNEFPVATRLRDTSDFYRAGIHANFLRWNLHLEEGGTTFGDNQEIGFTGINVGNRSTLLLGQIILLRDLLQTYVVRGRGTFTRAVLEARPWSRLNVAGQLLYSQPSMDVRYLQQNNGAFLVLETLQSFTGQNTRSLADSNRPHTSATWTTEFRPAHRLRVIQTWFTDRFHAAAASSVSDTFQSASETFVTDESATQRVAFNYSRHQVDVIADLTPFLTVRGGHRYEWGSAAAPSGLVTSPASLAAELRRNVGLAGGTVRVRNSFDVNFDFEAARSDRTFFRTDLADFQRARFHSRYRLSKWIAWTGSFAILSNSNETLGMNLDYRSTESSMTLLITPNDDKRWTLLLDYTRSGLRTSIPYLVPQDRTNAVSRYRDDGNSGGANVGLALWRGAKLNLGGSFYIDRGSRPTRDLQPRGTISVPLFKYASWTAEWRWFGFDERQFSFENFHTHLFATGLRLGRGDTREQGKP